MAFQFDQLHTLTVLVEEGTFDAAARRLHLTASAISQRVKAMEQQAGQILVQRTNPVVATDAGEVVLRLARQVQLLEADTAAELGQGAREGGMLTIPLAVNADCLATWFLEALSEVPAHTKVTFDIHREDQEFTTSLLRSGRVMAAVTSTAEAVQGCTSEKLGIMRYRAVASPAFIDRWLGGVAGITHLDEVPIVNFDRKDELQHRFLRRLSAGAVAAVPRHYVPTSADFARAIVLGFGWGLLPEQQCEAEIADGTLVELDPTAPVDVPLYWQRWNLSSPILTAVSDAVRETASEVLHPL